MSEEQWAPLFGFEDCYRISTLGNVQRTQPPSRKRALIYKNLQSYRVKSGYNHIFLNRPGEPSGRRQYRLCRLVLLSFIGTPSSNRHQANHKNGQKDDDRLENLEWVTPQENCRHAYDSIGRTKPKGSSHHSSKLTEGIVQEARRLAFSGVIHRDIAAKFGVTRACISMAISGASWGHVIT